MKDKVWSLGFGPVCCLFHHCPMTIYGGCPECNKQILKNMEAKITNECLVRAGEE